MCLHLALFLMHCHGCTLMVACENTTWNLNVVYCDHIVENCIRIKMCMCRMCAKQMLFRLLCWWLPMCKCISLNGFLVYLAPAENTIASIISNITNYGFGAETDRQTHRETPSTILGCITMTVNEQWKEIRKCISWNFHLGSMILRKSSVHSWWINI